MSASKAVGRTSKTSILVEAVNLRSQTDPPLSEASIGDVFWWGTAMANPNDETENEMSGLGRLVSEAIGLYKSEYVKSLQGGDGFESMSGYFEQLEGLFEEEKPDIFWFTSWCGFGFTGEDFGWGKSVWVTVMGKVGRAFRNLTVFVDSTERRGSIEAWVTLDRERMVVLERDPYFLEFASTTNPRISSL
ncbi:Stemmadenine O-acetyltransferase [Linum perenne]